MFSQAATSDFLHLDVNAPSGAKTDFKVTHVMVSNYAYVNQGIL